VILLTGESPVYQLVIRVVVKQAISIVILS
jgi:hypothetical protein